ncbi:MAG: hypothetical protein HFH59_07225 [Lachnospiraceae bacterium]|nr:hypothetical protein [Lachnospiraceae bacterium]
MNFGVTGKLGGHDLVQKYQKNGAAVKSTGVSFAELVAAKGKYQEWGATENSSLVNYYAGTHCSLKEFTNYYESELQTKGMSAIDYSQVVKGAGSFSDVFPNYQVITKAGTGNVQQGLWERNDFPFDKYFDNSTTVEELNNWRPTGKNPKMSDPVSQRRMQAVGPMKISIAIPEKLQEKMDADPEYARKIYAKVVKWKTDYDRWNRAAVASLGPRAQEITAKPWETSYCLVLDEEGEVKQSCVFGAAGGKLIGPSEEEVRQFKAEQAAKKKKREEYARLNEEAALKRRLMEQEALGRYGRL